MGMASTARYPAAAIAGAIGMLVAVGGCDLVFPDEAVDVLKDIVAGDGPSALKEETPAPVRATVRYEIDGRVWFADLYDPRQPIGAPLVLVPGAAQAGKDDPRLQALARSLARARFLVLVPDLPGPRALKISAADADGIADAVSYLAERATTPGGRQVGIAAISYGVGPAVLAAIRPGVRDKVRFVLGLGGYYDTRAMITYITTGAYRDPETGRWLHAAPLDYAKWVFVLSNVDRLQSASDRAALSEMARRRLRDPTAPIVDLARGLGPEGRPLLTLLLNGDPERVDDLVAQLPTAVRADIAALSLKGRDLSPLAGKLILIHGEVDRMIPYTESMALAAAAGRAELFIPAGFSHVDPDGIPIAGQRTLVRAMRALLARRDPLPGAS
jgi:pimeloyl-ACP methyl ester carboxylesterase